jgi:hypothetical protein
VVSAFSSKTCTAWLTFTACQSPLTRRFARNRARSNRWLYRTSQIFFHLRLKSRRDIPMYRLWGYRLRGLFYGQGMIPVERQEVELPEITPGIETRVDLTFSQSTIPP